MTQIQKSESVYFLQIFRDYLRRLYCHHSNKALNLESPKLIIMEKNKETYLVHVNGRKHVLKHSGHEFDLHAIRSKVVEDEEWMMSELLLVHPVLLQR